MGKELSDAQLDEQGNLRQQAAELAEDGGSPVKIVELLTKALRMGGPSVSAMSIAKRADMLCNKVKDHSAAEKDASLALTLNPDSAKALKVRAKSLRFLGRYQEASDCFAQSQKMDYDEAVEDLFQYCRKRAAKQAKREKMLVELESKKEEE